MDNNPAMNGDCKEDNAKGETVDEMDKENVCQEIKNVDISGNIDKCDSDSDHEIDDERRKSCIDEGDQVPEMKAGRFARRMNTRRLMWTSEESYENDREVARSNNPVEKILWAAEKNEVDLLRELIEKDASLVNARDMDQYTPLHRACYNDNIDAIQILLDNGADMSSRTADGWTPLHCACKWDNVASAAVLVAAGADINAATEGGQTPLHLAASNREGRETLELLLWQPEIDATIVNKAGDTAKSLAERSGNLAGLFELVEPSVNFLTMKSATNSQRKKEAAKQ